MYLFINQKDKEFNKDKYNRKEGFVAIKEQIIGVELNS